MASLINKAKELKNKAQDKLAHHKQDKELNKDNFNNTYSSSTTTSGAPLMSGTTTRTTDQFQQGGSFGGGHLSAGHLKEGQRLTDTGEQKLVLAEEKLLVGKREQEAGGIDIEKRVDRTTTNVPVTLEREVVSVERRPITGATGAISDSLHTGFGQQKELVATVHADQAIASKHIAPVEQVRVDKHKVTENKVEQVPLRTENVEVKRDVRDVDAIRWASGAGPAKVTHGNIVGPDGRIVAYEEQLAVGKERVAAGQVAVQKRVDTTTASAPISLQSDEVHVTREPVSGGFTGAPSSLTEGSAHIGLKKEVAQVGKVVVPKEEIVLRKGVQQEQHTVQAELAREHIQVKPSGAIEHRQGCSIKGCTDKQHLHDQTGFSQSTMQPGFQQGSSGFQQQGWKSDGSAAQALKQGIAGATGTGFTGTTAQPGMQLH